MGVVEKKTGMGIGWAVNSLLGGVKVRRGVWKDGHLWVTRLGMQGGGESQPIILLKMESGQGPWTPNQADLLANDWEVVS